MRFLSVADRELRSAARQKATYRARWVTAALFFVLLLWLLWVSRGLTTLQAGPQVFRVYSILTFLYCLFISTARTADCISLERREGTLSLLFLTNLNSAEIIAGKFSSSALASVYALMAIFPMLALPLLMGGITFGHFGRTVLAIVIGILSALAVGFLASVTCKRQFTAIALALGLTLCLSGGLMLGAAAADSYAPARWLAHWLALFSPLYPLMAAEGTRVFGANHFWHSAAAIAATSLGGLALATLLLACTWRDRPKRFRLWSRRSSSRGSDRPGSARRAALRRRLLAINPVFWLAAPQPVSSPVVMVLALILTAMTVFLTAPYFSRVIGTGAAAAVIGQLFAWLWTGLALHALVLYYAATTASQRLAEDKQSGALELLLSTPTSEKTISRGLWLAYGRKMAFPALLVLLVHCFFIYMCMVMAVLEPPGPIPPGTTPGQLFWCALLDLPIGGHELDWSFCVMMRIVMLLLLLAVVVWITLGWVGRWLGLRMKHPGFAPIGSLALVFTPPILLITLALYLADKFNLTRMPDRQFVPLFLGVALIISFGHCLVLSLWGATCLRHHLRGVALSRYQPPPAWRWRLPTRRTVRRCALGTAAFATAATLLVVSYYGYQNWRSQRAWNRFQSALKQSHQSLSLAPLLPEPISDEVNFARAPVFLQVLSRTNRQTKDLFERMSSFQVPANAFPPSGFLNWSRHTNVVLHPFLNWTKSQPGISSNRQTDAAAVLQNLEPQSGLLRDLAAAAVRLPVFQTSTNRDAAAVFHPAPEPTLLLERVQLLFQLRACALLTLGRSPEATEDVLTGLRLARLARQLPDTGSSERVQLLLMRSLQPLWEGLSQHSWTEPQLAVFQHELAGFSLLADYTNAVQRLVLAHIEIWRMLPASSNPARELRVRQGVYLNEPSWKLQPRAWWFENCIQLHNAGRNMLEQVDVEAGRIQQNVDWPDLNGLPLDSPSEQLLQQSWWWGANPASVAFAQTSLNQAIIACALERARMARSATPDTLQELVPAFLARVPQDAVSGRPMIYEPLAGNSFILRGVGPNGTADRNKPGCDDWLWHYSTNAPSTGK